MATVMDAMAAWATTGFRVHMVVLVPFHFFESIQGKGPLAWVLGSKGPSRYATGFPVAPNKTPPIPVVEASVRINRLGRCDLSAVHRTLSTPPWQPLTIVVRFVISVAYNINLGTYL